MPKKLTTEGFNEKANLVHNNRYDYSLVDYKDSRTDVIIICKKHGEFQQRPANHLNGANCIHCGREENTKHKLRTKEEFVKSCEEKHGNIYDYTETVYTNCKNKIKIRCKTHGIFELIADNHQRKDGCPTCSKEKYINKYAISFVEKSKLLHDNIFDYSLVNYIDNKTKVDIICPTHGVFEQLPLCHLQGNGCNKCNLEKRKDNGINTNSFIESANIVHNEEYIYTDTHYINENSKVVIRCKEHGIFEKLPYRHLNGQGCPKCSSLKTGLKIRSNTDKFIKTATTIHGDRYNYSSTKYVHSRQEIEIGCRIHGTFQQTPTNHIKGSGCQKCAKLINVYKREDYVKLAKTATLYLVMLEYNGEKFYKIGKTKNTTHERLSNNISMYKYYVISEYVADSGVIFDLEIELHNKYFEHKYKPNTPFAGHTECYSLDLPIDEILNL